MSGNYVLLQYGQEAWPARFEDLEGRLAFTVYVQVQSSMSKHDAEADTHVSSNTVRQISRAFPHSIFFD